MQPIQENHILEFMNLTECQDEMKALEFLQMGENNLDNAIQLYFQIEAQPQLSKQSSVYSQRTPQQNESSEQQSDEQEVKDLNTIIFNKINPPPPPELISQRSDPDSSLFEKKKKYQEEKRANDDNILKKSLNHSWNAIQKIFKKEPNYGIQFQVYLQQQQIKTNINFQIGNFDDNIKKSQDDTKPLVVYLHNHQSLFTFQKMIDCKSFISIINKNYFVVGFLESPQIQELLPVEPDYPSIQIYRLDLTDQVILMDTINLTPETNFEELALNLKQLKYYIDILYLEEDQVKNQINSIKYLPNYDDGQQQQQQQSQKKQQEQQQREREQLISQQQEAYNIAEQLFSEKIRQVKEFKQQEENTLFKQKQINEQRLLQKAKLLSNLPDEPEGEEGIEILFRFLHTTRIRRFNLNDKIQSIFDFAQCQDDDCFNDPNSNIDLIYNFPRLSLKGKKDETIIDLFTDSRKEQLIVEEI